MTLIWLFLRLLWYRDQLSIQTVIRKELVEKKTWLSEEQFAGISKQASIGFGSYKLTYAMLIGKQLGGFPLAIGLVLLLVVPSMCFIFGMMYGVMPLLHEHQRLIVGYGVMAVLAAYFVDAALRYLARAKQQLSGLVLVLLLAITTVLVVVMGIPIAYVVAVMVVFLFCWTKGGDTRD